MQQLPTRTDIDVALSIEDKVSAAECAIRTRRLIPHRDVWGYLAINQPFEQSDRTISGVACEPLWLKAKAPPDPVQHGPCNGDLGDPAGARALGIDDDPGFVVDEIIGVAWPRRAATVAFPCPLSIPPSRNSSRWPGQ